MNIDIPAPRPLAAEMQQARLEPFLQLAVFPLYPVLMAVVMEYSGFDLWWEARFYDAAARIWPWRDHWLFDQVIHSGGRQLNICLAALWLGAFLTSALRPALKKYQKPLLFFLAATATGPLLVGALKHITHIYTPWDIFSGSFPYIRLFDPVPDGLPAGGAFPAGHASGGYAFVSLYFLLDALGFSRKWPGLAPGLILGAVFGIGQQVRGAHFPSHDLITLAICWYSPLLIYSLFYPKKWRALFHA